MLAVVIDTLAAQVLTPAPIFKAQDFTDDHRWKNDKVYTSTCGIEPALDMLGNWRLMPSGRSKISYQPKRFIIQLPGGTNPHPRGVAHGRAGTNQHW